MSIDYVTQPLGQVRWPDEIMWSDEQQAKQGWLAIVPHDYLAEIARKARCWDFLEEARSLARQSPDDSGWKKVAREEGLIAGARACRASLGIGLREARDCVEGYLREART
jgi:hypothetical protein